MVSHIRERRKDKKWTQEELAEKSKVSVSYYRGIEQGRSSPSFDVLERIAKALDVSLLYLLNDRVDDMENRVDKEADRLRKLFSGIPKTQLQAVEGLITQAARLRILLDDNWRDILENGEYEKFAQSESQTPYDRKRPIVENYDNRDKTYQSIIKQLTDLMPQKGPNKKDALRGR